MQQCAVRSLMGLPYFRCVALSWLRSVFGFATSTRSVPSSVRSRPFPSARWSEPAGMLGDGPVGSPGSVRTPSCAVSTPTTVSRETVVWLRVPSDSSGEGFASRCQRACTVVSLIGRRGHYWTDGADDDSPTAQREGCALAPTVLTVLTIQLAKEKGEGHSLDTRAAHLRRGAGD